MFLLKLQKTMQDTITGCSQCLLMKRQLFWQDAELEALKQYFQKRFTGVKRLAKNLVPVPPVYQRKTVAKRLLTGDINLPCWPYVSNAAPSSLLSQDLTISAAMPDLIAHALRQMRSISISVTALCSMALREPIPIFRSGLF